jgi:hypothetical protein
MRSGMMSYRIHPYEEMIIKQRLNPTPRHAVHPVQTEPLREPSRVTALVREAAGAVAGLFDRRATAEPCPAC